jgi:putative endonuclease
MYFVYIVKCADDTYYTGIAKDMQRRLEEHNTSPKGAKYTKARRPVTLVYKEICADRSGASKREHAIKRLKRVEKERLVIKYTKVT